MHHIFFPELKSSDTKIDLKNKEEIHHLLKVLRFKEGGTVGLLNGSGLLAEASISSIEKTRIALQIHAVHQKNVLKPEIHLLCAVPKKDRWEWLLEKGTELGATSITPLMTKNSDVVWDMKTWKKKADRHRKILISSAKQCNSIFLPDLRQPISFNAYMKNATKTGHILMPALLDQAKPFLETLEGKKTLKSFDVLIGPEGDFTPKEYDFAEQKKISFVTLGPQILRVETAAMTSLAFIRQIFV